MQTIIPGLVAGKSESIQEFGGLCEFEGHVQNPAPQHVGDSEIAGRSGEEFRHHFGIGICLLSVIDDCDERARARRQWKVTDASDLACGLKVEALQDGRFWGPAHHAFGDSGANRFVDVVVRAEEGELVAGGEHAAQFDVGPAVPEPALHLHLGVGQRVSR